MQTFKSDNLVLTHGEAGLAEAVKASDSGDGSQKILGSILELPQMNIINIPNSRIDDPSLKCSHETTESCRIPRPDRVKGSQFIHSFIHHQ